MKIEGIDLDAPTTGIIPIIRGEQEIIFQAACITDFDEFERVCKLPDPPYIMKRGSTKSIPDFNDKDYLNQIDDYNSKRSSWMIAKSLLATPGLEWEKVDFENPDTFELWRDELKEKKFTDLHINQLVRGISEANGVNEERITEARNRFLAMEHQAPEM